MQPAAGARARELLAATVLEQHSLDDDVRAAEAHPVADERAPDEPHRAEHGARRARRRASRGCGRGMGTPETARGEGMPPTAPTTGLPVSVFNVQPCPSAPIPSEVGIPSGQPYVHTVASFPGW